MAKERIREAFSRHRLAGAVIPADVAILLDHAEDLEDLAGIELNWKKKWEPWADTSYLTPADRQNPDVMANVRAISDVCACITFIAADDEDQCLGYWRGPDLRPLDGCPVVLFDNEGQFNVCGLNFAEAILSLAPDEEDFAELKDWLREIGIAVRVERFADIVCPTDGPTPAEMHDRLYRQYLAQGAED